MNTTNPTGPSIEPIVGTLRLADGTRLGDAAPYTTVLASPPRAARGREGEQLFTLLDLTGPASPHLYRELREVMAQTYWSTTGSITAALRQAAAAANRYLFHINLRSVPSDRCSGGLICAILHDDDLFILRAGSGRACFLHRDHLKCFLRDEELPLLGTGRLVNVRLHHTFIAPGDTLLLASSALIQEAGGEAIARVLPHTEVHEALEGLEQIGAGADFTALVVRWALPEEALADRETPQPLPPPSREPPRPRPRARPKPARAPGPSLGERLGGVKEGIRAMGRGIAASVRFVGRGIAGAGAWLTGGMSMLFRHMLPGAEREARRQARHPRPVPSENRAVMMAIAIGIPIVLAIIVALAYISLGGKEARFQRLINQADVEISLAQAAGSVSEEARSHWEAALDHANAATTLRPDDPVAAELHAQAQSTLDRLGGIVRLQPIRLWNFGPGTVPRQLVIHGQTIFVLDAAGGWVARLTLNSAGDGIVEQENPPPLVQAGQQIGTGEVGSLVDFAWVEMEGGRQTSGLLILEENGALVDYDPAWEGEGGAPQLKRSFLGTPPASPVAVGSFKGRFYVLDTAVDQIRRYEPQGDTYPERPDHYFVVSPPRPLGDVLDMVIDGNIYILYADGAILKFLGGEPEPFDVRGLPDNISQAVALTVDPDGSSGVVYVADQGDQGNGRVVALGTDGAFQSQFRADEVFDALEALAVDEASKRLYVINGGRLYVASLP